MSNSKPEGACHLCGVVGFLSYEHVPPQAAFNDAKVYEADMKRILYRGENLDSTSRQGRFNQRGAGGYTLCQSCNSTTGGWYAKAYIQFAKEVHPAMYECRSGAERHVGIECRPHAVLKQILTMFCSANPPEFAQNRPDLIRYLLNRELEFLPTNLSVHIALYDPKSEATRQSAMTFRIDMSNGERNAYSEICFPPLNIILTESSNPPDRRFFDVTWFRKFGIDELSKVSLNLHNLEAKTHIPGIFAGSDRG